MSCMYTAQGTINCMGNNVEHFANYTFSISQCIPQEFRGTGSQQGCNKKCKDYPYYDGYFVKTNDSCRCCVDQILKENKYIAAGKDVIKEIRGSTELEARSNCARECAFDPNCTSFTGWKGTEKDNPYHCMLRKTRDKGLVLSSDKSTDYVGAKTLENRFRLI